MINRFERFFIKMSFGIHHFVDNRDRQFIIKNIHFEKM